MANRLVTLHPLLPSDLPYKHGKLSKVAQSASVTDCKAAIVHNSLRVGVHEHSLMKPLYSSVRLACVLHSLLAFQRPNCC